MFIFQSYMEFLNQYRYEWSVGHSEFSTPLGIYDIQDEKVWQDAGQLHDAIFTIEQGNCYLL